ncbi:Serendipity locus protein H-1 [Danaus plexippus plexippus]|uniref:Serendipity locus protein H-1 n=1 Tax=Danaus plexippus plexippus TaxID=278856 RepID=A0A212F1V5_DANPL|nr:Serendipity locus protein H-1 [Danaus plexippus plexippus]
MVESNSDFERCCRLCAEEQEVTIMIFSKEAEVMLLQNKLNKYLLIEVDEDDKLPKNICIQCCSKLQIVSEFIDNAHRAQEVLLKQSLMLEDNDENKPILITDIKSETDFDSDTKCMEVNVDPMMVLQNSEVEEAPNLEKSCESVEYEDEITYLNGADGENVTIKLIKKGDKLMEDDKKDTKPFQCITCNRGYYTELALKNHSWIHFNEDKIVKPFKCSSCGDQFEYKNELISHLKEHRTRGMCNICGRLFRNENNLVEHMEAHTSTSSRSYTCKVCGRSYNTSSNLKTHMVTHSNERPYKCIYCKKSFKRNQDLKFHINQHTGAKPYKCPYCDKSFASSGNCYSHKSRMHPEISIGDGKMKKDISEKIKETKKPVMKQQLKLRPIAPKPVVLKANFKYQCTICHHSFMKRDNFMYHMYQHTGEKPFHCLYCDEKFVTRKGLLIHHDIVHNGQDRPLALLSKNVLLK